MHSQLFDIVVALLSTMVVFHGVAYAYVASSTNYRIESDSVNVGGLLSTSTNYRLEDTVGEAGTGTSSSATFRINAGYQQMQETSLSVTPPGNISLSPAIPTTGGGTANGQATWTIMTDNPAGYTASISASGTPALVSGGNNFANYTPAGGDPDYVFSVGASSAEFGYSPEGADIPTRFQDNGAACNVSGGDTSDRCWDPLPTSPTLVATRTQGTGPSGSTLTIKFRAESGASNIQPPGSYQATTTMTVLPR